MRRVAKKSTTLGPQKSAVSQRLNGSLQESAAVNQNGHHASKHSDAPAAVVASMTAVTNGTVSSSSARTCTASSSSLQPHLPSPLVGDHSVSAADSDCEVVGVDSSNAQSADKVESRLKRHVTMADQCTTKKSRIDTGTTGAAVSANVNKLTVSQKELDERILACASRFLNTSAGSELNQLLRKVKELEESRDRWKNKALELEQKITELSARQTASLRPAVRSSVTSIDQGTVSAVVQPSKMYPLLSKNLSGASLLSSSASAVVQLASPSRQQSPSTSATSIVPFLSRTRPAILLHSSPSSNTSQPISATVVPVSLGATASVIDLTDDDDSSTAPQTVAVTMQPFNLPSLARAAVFRLANPTSYQGLAPTLAAASTAIVKPYTTPTVVRAIEMRPPPPLHSAPTSVLRAQLSSHPAALPAMPGQPTAPPTAKRVPARPSLKLSRVAQGIVLSWNMPTSDLYEPAVHYQLYAYQQSDQLPSPALWKRVGTVDALPLPMACTLTQFQVGNIYHFAVRAVDVHSRVSAFSEPGTIHLEPMVDADDVH